MARNVQLDALAAICDGGSVQGYDGPMPKDPDSQPVGTRLFVCRLASPAFGKARSGSIKAKAIAPDESAVEGHATWYRVLTAAGHVVWDGEVGPGGLELDDPNIPGGADVTIAALVYTLPE